MTTSMTDTAPRLPRSFTPLAASNLAAQSAEQLSQAAVPMVAVLALGAGPGAIGLLAAAQSLPFLLFALPFGVWADRGSRRRLMLGAEALRGTSLLALAALVLLGGLSIPALVGLGFVGALGTVAFSVAAPALVPELVPREQLARANGRLELARSAAFTAGPAAGGALVAWGGASGAFVLAAVLSGAALACLLRIVEPVRVAAPRRHPWLELTQGARVVWQRPLLRPILLTAVAWNIAWFVLQAAYVPYAVRTLGLDPATLGLTLAVYGVGMLVGALAAPRVVAALPFGRAIQLGPLASVLAAALLAATLVVPQAWLAGVAYFLFGVGPIIWSITSMTLRQSVTEGAMLGRVSAMFLTVNMGARPVGAALGGLVGTAWGEPACLLLALAGFGVQLAIILASPVSALRSLASAPAPASA